MSYDSPVIRRTETPCPGCGFVGLMTLWDARDERVSRHLRECPGCGWGDIWKISRPELPLTWSWQAGCWGSPEQFRKWRARWRKHDDEEGD
jgi:ribosomal protein S27AE